MIPKEMKENILKQVKTAVHPREKIVDVMYAFQEYYGYFSDGAVREAAELLDMTPLEIEELATFYDFIYREPVGRYVIHVCDSAVCWMYGSDSLMDYLGRKLGISAGETTPDGLFTLLPVCCIGYCDHAPAMLINGKPYGEPTPDSVDQTIDRIRKRHPKVAEVK